MRRIDAIRELARDYGQASLERCRHIRAFGNAMADTLNLYLGGEQDKLPLVFLVPPFGDWKSDTDYRDRAFSDFGGLLDLVPVSMGIAVRIDNLADDGALWVRLVVGINRAGDRLEVDVPGGGVERVPLTDWSRANMTAICEALTQSLERLFRDEFEVDRHGLYGSGRIGFQGPMR